MFTFIEHLATNFYEAIILILGFGILGLVQFILTKRQTKSLKANDFHTIGQNFDAVNQTLKEIKELLIRIDTKIDLRIK